MPIINDLTERFLLILHDKGEDRDIVQSAGYGLGVFAKRCPIGEFKHLPTVLNALDKFIGEEDAR